MRSIMWQYIKEEPEVLGRLIASDQCAALADKLAKRIKAVYFVAHGSSYNAAVTVRSWFFQLGGMKAYAYVPGDLFCGGSALLGEERDSALVVAISQTGNSRGVLQAITRATELGFTTLAVTARQHSPIGMACDQTIDLLCGTEESNAKTKGYTATLALLLQLAASLGLARGSCTLSDQQGLLGELSESMMMMPELFARSRSFCERISFGSQLQDLCVLGSTVHIGSAQEAQLKLMETMCIPTMYNDIGEFSHGMHRSINDSSSMLLLRCDDEDSERMGQIFSFFSKITPNVWMIDATGQTPPDERCLPLPKLEQTKSLLPLVLAIQILSVYAPENRGLDPNRDSHNEFTVIDGTRV